ncbi:MFS transporter [Salinibacterium sp. TMP30]|uniref:MFS transporter n=1 Tax=Salinibacterium sp. TMP30 TaxID=3138237 RepID=UPI003138BC53
MLTNVVVAAGTAIVLVNSVVYARSVFELGGSALAIMLAFFGVGSLLIALNIPPLVERFGVIRTIITSTLLITIGLSAAVIVTAVAAPSSSGWGWLLATWMMLGMGTSLVNTPSSRLLADASTPANRNLVYTAQFALSHACFLVTYPIAGLIGASSLTLAVLVLLAVAVVTTVSATAFAFAHRLRHTSEQSAAATAG